MWTLCGDQTALGQLVILANWMPRYYTDEIALMGPPVPDTLGGPAEAGDGPIDIYLTSQCVSTGGRCLGTGHDSASVFGFEKPARPCQAVGAADRCSGFLVINRSNFSNLDTPGTLAHEFFHLLQDAHNSHGTLVSGVYNWFVEASAKWAQFRWHPASRPRRVYPYFDDFISTKLGLTTVDGNNEYVSFVWPLFMTESGPAGEDLIGQAWRAIEGQAGNKAVNTAISGALPFDTKFRDFAVTAWNDPLEPGPDPISPHFWDLDGGLSHEMPSGPKFKQEDLQANDRSVPPLRISVAMPALSARYAELFPSEGVHQITVNFSNLAPAANFDVDALLNIKDKGWEHRKLDKGDTRFCRDDPADDVQELIIVLANHDIESSVSGDWTVESLKEPCAGYQVEIDWTDVYDNVPDTIHFKGQIDTVDLTLPTDSHTLYMTGTGTASGARAGWKACNPGIADTPQGNGTATFQAIITDDTITVSAFADIDNPLSGVTTDLFMANLEEVDKPDGATVVVDPRQPLRRSVPALLLRRRHDQGVHETGPDPVRRLNGVPPAGTVSGRRPLLNAPPALITPSAAVSRRRA